MNRAVAAWLLRVADRVETLAYLFDDRAWARPPFGVVQATLDTVPLRERLRPPDPLPMDDGGSARSSYADILRGMGFDEGEKRRIDEFDAPLPMDDKL